VSYLLVEKLDDADISALKDALKKTKDTLETAMKSYKSQGVDLSGVKGISDYYEKLTDALGSIQKTVAEVELEGDPGLNRRIPFMGQEADARQVLRVAAAIQGRASQFIEALGGGVQKVVDALDNIDELDREKPVSEQAGQGNIPSLDKIKSAIDRALEQAVPKKGILAQMMGFFKKKAGLEDKILANLGEPDLGAFVALLLKHTWTQLNNIATALNKIPSAAENEVPADVVTSFVNPSSTAAAGGGGAPGAAGAAGEAGGGAGGGAGAEGPGGGGAGEAPAGASLSDILFQQIDPEDKGQGFKLGEYDPGTDEAEQVMGLENLATTLKDLAAKPNNKNRKNFIKYLNRMIGKNTFESVGNLRVPMLSEVLLSTNKPRGLKSPSQDYDLGSDRWLKLAGLEEE
jgi:hypothetical protein